MNVTSKIVLVASLALLPVLGLHTWLSLEREEALFRSDMERDLSLLGAHLRGVASIQWRRDGAEGVRAALEAAARADPRTSLEWRPEPLGRPGLDEREGRIVWVEPLVIAGSTVGEIVVSEPLAPMHAYLRSTLLRLGALTLFLIVGALLATRLLSHRLIGRRLDQLVDFAARTGAGQLGLPVEIGGRDEITRLAASLGRMSEALARANQEAERSNEERLMMLDHLRHADRLASLGRLAGSIAHELGTPLNVVMGHADRIAEGSQAPGETKESAATIHRQVKKMETTIRDILGFVRQAPEAVENVDLAAVVHSVHGLLQPLAQRRGVRMDVDVAVSEALVPGRVVQLEQALSNLVSNAIDASPEGGRVLLGLSREKRAPRIGSRAESVILLRVQDQGPGISEGDSARLFEAFYTSKAPGQGTGLGLWLADGIVRDHGGSIEVANREQGGACFSIVLPESGGI